MLFDAAHFEQFFDERILKKGLRLFERSQVELLGRHAGSELRFAVAGMELSLKKRGDKILSYHCSCNSNRYCEHLVAALFFIQQETLSLIAKKRSPGKTGNKNHRASKKITYTELLGFLSHKGKTAPGSNKAAQIVFTAPEEDHFELYRSFAGLITTHFSAFEKLEQEQTDEALAMFHSLEQQLKKLHLPGNTHYYFTLALLVELQTFMQLRFTADERKFKQLVEDCCEQLDEVFCKGLQAKERAAWQEAVFASLRNNRVVRSGAYSFLLPRLLSWLRSKTVFEELREVLARRKVKPFYTERFDPLLIAAIQLQAREQAVFKVRITKDSEPVEEAIAKAVLAFCAQKIHKGFKLLDAGYERLLATNRHYFDAYTSLILHYARHYGQQAIELKFLEERIVRNLYLQPGELERLLELLPKKEGEEKIGHLIERLQNLSFAFDKLAVIYQRTGRYDELIYAIKKQDHAYRLLHETVLKKLPHYTQDYLLLYARQFINAMAGLSLYSHQLTLFDTARLYIDQLPADARDLVLDKIIVHSGSESQLSKHIRAIYGL